MYLLAYCNHKFSAGNFTFNGVSFLSLLLLPTFVRVWRCVYDVSGSPELSQCQLTKDLLKACFKMALKRVGFGVCARMCVCMQVSTRVCVFVIERLSLCMRGFCCCCISQCPVHLEGYGRPLDRPGMLAKHFSSICVCVCVCHFEGGKISLLSRLSVLLF